MKKFVLKIGVLALFFAVGCGADKSSNEACLYETTMNLDKGNYDAVLASGCVDPMQKGAAYFGKAGYDVTSVINSFSKTGAGNTTIESNLMTYMNELTGEITGDDLNYINSAIGAYNEVQEGTEYYQDAQFYLSIVQATNAVSLLKSVADTFGLATLSNCDINNNTIIDDADIASCALLTSVGEDCTSVKATSSPTNDITISKAGVQLPGTYRGLIITVDIPVDGTATESCPNSSAKKLLYKDSANPLGGYSLATTSSDPDECDGSDGNKWPCPVIKDDAPLDIVAAIDDSIDAALEAMKSALPEGTAAEVKDAISDIKSEACGGPTETCKSSDLSAYLQKLNIQ